MLTKHDPRASAITPGDAEQAFRIFRGEPALLLAVSGGPDSTALLVLAARWRAESPEHRPRLIAATVDHRWRKHSRGEAEAVGVLCERLGVPHRILTVEDEVPLTGVEEAGRTARYRLLFSLCRSEGCALVTAHTLDDQAETVLLRLAAGSGPAGLAAMRPSREQDGLRHLRPFLDVPKTRLVALLDEAGIPYSTDPSNCDPRLARGRLRRSAEVLAAEGLSAERLAVLARRMARLDAAIEAMLEEALAECGLALDGQGAPLHICGKALEILPDEVALRLLARCIAARGDGTPPLAGLERLYEAVKSALCEAVPVTRTLAGARVAVAGGSLRISRAPPRRMPSASRNPARC